MESLHHKHDVYFRPSCGHVYVYMHTHKHTYTHIQTQSIHRLKSSKPSCKMTLICVHRKHLKDVLCCDILSHSKLPYSLFFFLDLSSILLKSFYNRGMPAPDSSSVSSREDRWAQKKIYSKLAQKWHP